MAVLALSAIGAAVGSWAVPGTILGMSGAGFGWMVGSMAGSLLFPPKAPDGPRLEDKAVQVSTYGQPLPRVYGTHRLAGNVIWSTELIESAHEEGGKGGPSYTTYSYRASFAVSVCRGPIAGIRRIWADGKLIFDQSETNTGPQRDFDAQSLAIYTGTNTQLPDPTMQALQGDVPAYRDQAYVVFTDLQLEKFGNRLPSLTFEVVQSGTYTSPPPAIIGNGVADGAFDPETGYFWTHNSEKTVYVHDVASGVQLESVDVIPSIYSLNSIGSIGYFPAGFWFQANPPIETSGYLPRSFYLGAGSVSYFGGVKQGGFYVSADARRFLSAGYINGSAVGRANGSYRNPITGGLYANAAGSTVDGEVVVTGLLGPTVMTPDPYGRITGTEGQSPVVFTLGDTGYAGILCEGLISYVGLINLQTDVLEYKILTSFSAGQQGAAFDPTRENILHVKRASGQVGYLTNFRTRISQTFAVPDYAGEPVYHEGRDAWIVAGPNAVHELHPETLALIRSTTVSGYNLSRLYTVPDAEDYVLATTAENVLLKVFISPRLASLPVPLSDVVTDESALVGLEPSDLDVSALASVNVAGFSATGSGAVRSGIEQLMMAYQFDAVESGGVVKFVRRGGAVVATLDDADLAAHQPGNEVPTPLALTRAEEVELPQRITVRYANPAADYQTGAQSAQRLTGRAMAQQGVDLPIVLTDSQAVQIAEAALYSAWTARTSTSFTTTLKHADLEPTDVIVAGGNTLRITRRMENAGLLTFDAAFENGNVFTQSALGAPADIPLQTIEVRGRTALYLLDIPPLRDVDDDHGYYVAASGYSGQWDGAIVYKSADGGASYAEMLAIPSASTAGVAVTVLAAGDGQNVFDEINAVSISVRSGQLSSLSETAVLNGGNAALIGREIIQFKTATLESDGTYTLRGLLRQRKGTPSEGHAVGDEFVLLTTATLRRAESSSSEVGLERSYKAVTFGGSLASAAVKSFTNTAQSLEPLAPVHLGGGRSAAGDVLISWVRRTRVGGAWRDKSDAPLSESSESYEVDVFSDNTYAVLKRTLASATTSLTYTAAQQATDFGSTQATVYCRVYQLSATNGRGTALQGTV